MAALAEMYVQGVSTRKVKAITEELCGHSFSASSISAINQRLDASAINQRLDASLAQFAGRGLAEAFPYLILDALRAGARGRGDLEPSSADRDWHRLGRPAPGAGGRAGQPGEPIELAGFSAWAQGARSFWRRVRGRRRPRGAARRAA